MKLKHIYSFLLGIITIVMRLEGHANKDESTDYTQYVAEVSSSFLKQVYKEYGFECGASGGSMPYDIEEISVQLVAFRSATIEQARELEVTLTEKFTQIINAHEKIRPFLRESPFPPSRVSVSISFENKKKKKKIPMADDEVTFVFQAKNKIFYTNDKPNGQYHYTNIKNEPYEEARVIVQGKIHKQSLTESKEL